LNKFSCGNGFGEGRPNSNTVFSLARWKTWLVSSSDFILRRVGEVKVSNQAAVDWKSQPRSRAAAAAAGVAQESPVNKLAQFFTGATPMRIPVRVTVLNAQGVEPVEHVLSENTVIEAGTAQEVLFISSLPLEFEDKVRLENTDGSLRVEAAVVAVQYHSGKTVVAARFTREISNWIIKA
jgi:hypothetical protein